MHLDRSLEHSFFIKELASLTSFFHVATVVQVDTGRTQWRWEANLMFSTASAYRVLHHKGVKCPYDARLWKFRIPPKVKVFILILLRNKILTRDIFMKRGCQAIQGCVLFGEECMEMSVHLFWDCTYSSALWLTTMRATQGPVTTVGCDLRVAFL